MPDASWPGRVQEGLNALSNMQAGILTVEDMELGLSGDVDTNDDLANLMPFLGADWQSDITVLNPPPEANVTIDMDAEGNLAVSGILPSGLDARTLAAMLPGLDVSGLDLSEVGKPADWIPAAEALNIVLPRLEQATVRLKGQSLGIAGILRRGFSADGSVAAVQNEMPEGWELDLDLRESAPLSEMVFSKREGELVLSGVLPLGLGEEEALALAGENAGGEALASAGEGDAGAWRQLLSSLSKGLVFFDSATGEINAGNLAINGILKPGYTPVTMQTWMSGQLVEGWTLSLTADETPANEGDARTNLLTDETETFRSGYWLPDVDFAVSPETCQTQVDTSLSNEKIQFVTGSARIDDAGRTLLNRLAAVAVRCLNSSILRLNIAGHTDSRGDDATNQALSEERAQAVLRALADRGVRADAMEANGFGETQPIAPNNTPEGRADNRRIDFVWSAQNN